MKYTEEEKEAIDEAKTIVSIKYGSIMHIEIRNMEKILNLLEKQQKEIEEKDKLICFNRKYINELEQDLFENASNYVISKEAIREKIKEIEENGYWDFLEKGDCEKTINILKELLGE